MTDAEFEARLKTAVHEAAELDYMPQQPQLHEIHRVDSRKRALRIAACFAAIIVVLSAVTVASPSVYADFYTLMTHIYSTHDEFSIQNGVSSDTPQAVRFGYIPQGYEVSNENYKGLIISAILSNNDEEITVLITGNGSTLDVDNEYATISKTTIGNFEATIYESTIDIRPNSLIMFDNSRNLIICIDGFVPIKELEKIAESISY
jgi:hypothetical protein